MKHIIGNIWHIPQNEAFNIQFLKLKWERKYLKHPLLVGTGENDLFWENITLKQLQEKENDRPQR